MMSEPLFVPRRLGKLLGERTALTVAQVAEAWQAGRIEVKPGAEVGVGEGPVALESLVFEADRVLLDGEEIGARQRHEYAVLNKPRGVTSTARDPGRKRDLREWLGAMPPGMFPVGRLDRDTSGVLLFTTDGDLANAMLRPEHHAEKLYWLWLDERLSDGDERVAAMLSGIQLGERLARAKRAWIEHRTDDLTELLVVLDEGQNRQIRRMCRALDLRLVQLHRLAVGPVRASDLGLGEWRPLTPAEIDSLWSAVGGQAYVRQRKIAALRRQARRARDAGLPLLRLEAWLQFLERSDSDSQRRAACAG